MAKAFSYRSANTRVAVKTGSKLAAYADITLRRSNVASPTQMKPVRLDNSAISVESKTGRAGRRDNASAAIWERPGV